MAVIIEKIKFCVIKELCKLEERKLVRREQAEILRKRKLREEEDVVEEAAPM